MKKLLCGIVAGMLLLSACAQKEPAPTKIVAGGGPKSSGSAVSGEGEPSEAPVDAESQDKILAQLAEDLNNPSFRLTAQCPETQDAPYQRVRTDDDFGPRIAKILTAAEIQPVENNRPGGRLLTLQGENGNLLDEVAFWGPEEGADSTNMMAVVTVDGVEQQYAFEESVFQQLDALYRERTEGVKTEFKGNATLIFPKYDLAKIQAEKGYDVNEFLQFGTRVLWRFTPHTDDFVKRSTVELLDTVTGQSLYTSTISETVTRMEKFDGEAGFDYRLITPTGILYRSAGDRSREKVWRLPGIVSLFSASQELSGTFDIWNGKLAYAGEDGIYLADEDGGNAQPLLFHSALAEVMRPAAAAGYTYYFNDPRFLLGGKRLATSIVSPQTGQRRLGFAVTNLDTMETSYFTGATAASSASVRYLNDKIISAQDEGMITLINAENGDRGALPLNGLEGSLFFTYDCKSFAVWEPKVTGTEAHSSVMYLSNNQNINDLSKKLLDSYGGEYRPVGITEEYVIGLNEDSRGLQFAVTRYQTLRGNRASAAESSSSAETSSSQSSSSAESKEESSEGELPPDITPDL